MADGNSGARGGVFEWPELRLLGSVHDLTLQNKQFSGADGIFLQPGNVPLGNAS